MDTLNQRQKDIRRRVNDVRVALGRYGYDVNLLAQIDQCILFSSRELIPFPECIKEILLRHQVPLSYTAIESLKYELVKLAKLGQEFISLVAVEDENKLSAEDKKYMPRVDEIYRTHLSIHARMWNQAFELSEAKSKPLSDDDDDDEVKPFGFLLPTNP